MRGINIDVEVNLEDCTVVVPVTYWPESPASHEDPGEPQDYDLAGAADVFMSTADGQTMPGHHLSLSALPDGLRDRVHDALDASLDAGCMADLAGAQRQQDACDRAGV